MLKIAIVGCNNMGKKHLDVLQENYAGEVEIAGIMNSTPESSKKKALELNVSYFNSLDEIIKSKVDGVIIATPATTHQELAEKLLRHGIPCMIEKPLAPKIKDCEAIIQAASEGKAPLLVGHLENFNPAVIKFKEMLNAPIKSLKAIRTSRGNNRKRDVSVVQELMIHDLAIVVSLLGNEPSKIAVSKNPEYDWQHQAKVEMQYGSVPVFLEACIGDVTHERLMEVIDEQNNIYQIDFINKILNKNGEVLAQDGNSLVNELGNFINTIKKTEAPFVSGEEAKGNIELCRRIEFNITALELAQHQTQSQSKAI